MPFAPGKTKTGGRQAGTPNRFTGAFRDAVQIVYDGLGGHEAFLEWARANPTEYYKIAARLTPVELRPEEDRRIVVQILPPPRLVEPTKRPVLIEDQPPGGRDERKEGR